MHQCKTCEQVWTCSKKSSPSSHLKFGKLIVPDQCCWGIHEVASRHLSFPPMVRRNAEVAIKHNLRSEWNFYLKIPQWYLWGIADCRQYWSGCLFFVLNSLDEKGGRGESGHCGLRIVHRNFFYFLFFSICKSASPNKQKTITFFIRKIKFAHGSPTNFIFPNFFFLEATSIFLFLFLLTGRYELTNMILLETQFCLGILTGPSTNRCFFFFFSPLKIPSQNHLPPPSHPP